jgi:inosine-uridine nucleoside N-ribohydrolase
MDKTVIEKSSPIIYDTDMGADDWIALLMLLRCPKIDIKSITVTGAGMAHIESGVQHAHDLLLLASHELIPVAKGSEVPLRGSHAFPASWREETDNMHGLSLPHFQFPSSPKDAVDTIISVIQESLEKVTLLATGPLTNVAVSLIREPSIISKLKMIYIMGGAVNVPGNIETTYPQIKNTVAEWNIFVDPFAASIVFASGAPITLIPLDATNQAPVTEEFYDQLKQRRITAEANFVFKILTQKLDSIRNRQYYFWDPLAVGITIDESLGTVRNFKIRVLESEGDESGRTLSDESGNPARVCIDVDNARFQKFCLDILN